MITPATAEMTRRWQGRGAAPGVVQGLAHVIRTDRDLDGFVTGRVLLTRHATAELYPALVQARAAVCETGGALCHLAVLARELGKPCVTGAQGIIDVVETGDGIRVDGGRGVVESTTRDRRGVEQPGSSPRTTAAGCAPAKVPIVQFGQFSAAFQCLRASIDLETVVRIAALLSVPAAFGIGARWAFEIVGNQVLVEAEAVDSAAQALVERLEVGDRFSDELRSGCDELGRSPMWLALAHPEADVLLVDRALLRYVRLNQLTWAAIVAKEPFADRYRRFLLNRLPDADPYWLHDQFLQTIVLPGHSYIQRLWTGGDWAPSAVSPLAPSGDLEPAERRRHAALDELARRLDRDAMDRVRRYLETLSILVQMAERKNTDLARCGHALFKTSARRQAVAHRLGIGEQPEAGWSTPAGQHVIEDVTERLCHGRL